MKVLKKNEDQFVKDAENALRLPRSHAKVRITAMIDADIIDRLKELSCETGVPYQTLLNASLRQSVLNETVVDKSEIDGINKKIEKLEKKFAKLVRQG